jgi:hypothetical protein
MDAMKFTYKHLFILFFIAVVTILARPCLVYTAPALTSHTDQQTCALDLRQVVRKRNEYIAAHQYFLISDQRRKSFGLLPLSSVFSLARKWMISLLLIRSHFFSSCIAFVKKQATFFQISPHNDEYLSLSVFRI